MQILLAVLSRKYNWEVDLQEPVKSLPSPHPAWGLPMSFTQLANESNEATTLPQKLDKLTDGINEAVINLEVTTEPGKDSLSSAETCWSHKARDH